MKNTQIIAVLLITCLILSGCSSQKQVEEKWTVVQQKAHTFADGGYVDLWRLSFGGRDLRLGNS